MLVSTPSFSPPIFTCRANSFAERLRLGLAVIHGEPKDDTGEDGRYSPPPQGGRDDNVLSSASVEELGGTPSRHKANLLSVVPKEKPPLNVVGDVHGRIAIIVVSSDALLVSVGNTQLILLLTSDLFLLFVIP